MENCTGEPTFQENHLEIIEMNSQTNHSFLNDALECFSKAWSEKTLPYWWLYDEKGSEIFEGFFYFLKKV